MPPSALLLPDRAAAQILAGAPVVELSLLPEPGVAAEPGRPLVFLDPHGGAIGSGIADPENEVLRVLSRDAVDSFDAAFFRRRVEAALRLRSALGLPGERSAYRLLNAEGDGLSGFLADVYGSHAVLYVLSRGLINLGRMVAQAIISVLGPRGVVLKVRPK